MWQVVSQFLAFELWLWLYVDAHEVVECLLMLECLVVFPIRCRSVALFSFCYGGLIEILWRLSRITFGIASESFRLYMCFSSHRRFLCEGKGFSGHVFFLGVFLNVIFCCAVHVIGLVLFTKALNIRGSARHAMSGIIMVGYLWVEKPFLCSSIRY